MTRKIHPGLVSVVMPSFNHEAFVAVAMQSVHNQSYEDVEFLVIDDCSTDSTLAMVYKIADNRRFRRRFRRLEICRNDRNIGAGQTLNMGIAETRGEYVTFINSDDAYQPNRLSSLTSLCQTRDEPFLAFSSVRLIDATGTRIRSHELKDVLEGAPERLQTTLPSLSFGFLRHQLTGSTGNICVNRELLEETGGFSPLKDRHDWEYMLRGIAITEPLYAPQTTYMYRVHPRNAFSSLQHLVKQDTASTLGSYFRLVANGRIRNRLAPAPQNWPSVFEMFTRQFGIYEAWQREARYRPRYASRQPAGNDAPE